MPEYTSPLSTEWVAPTISNSIVLPLSDGSKVILPPVAVWFMAALSVMAPFGGSPISSSELTIMVCGLCPDVVSPHPKQARNTQHSRMALSKKIDRTGGFDALRVICRTGLPCICRTLVFCAHRKAFKADVFIKNLQGTLSVRSIKFFQTGIAFIFMSINELFLTVKKFYATWIL